jgi:hypothetical protein
LTDSREHRPGFELVLRLASLLWPLRRATTIEAGLFEIQARQLLQFRQRRQTQRERQKIIGSLYRNALVEEDETRQEQEEPADVAVEPSNHSEDLTRAFVRLFSLPIILFIA